MRNGTSAGIAIAVLVLAATAPSVSAQQQAPAATPAEAVRVPVEVLNRYVGEYEVGPEQVITVRRRGDTLTGQPPGQPEFVLDPLSETRFRVRGTSAAIEVEFVTEAGVMYKVLHQNGQQMRAPRRPGPGGGEGGAAG